MIIRKTITPAAMDAIRTLEFYAGSLSVFINKLFV
jgi:hypothetical protein